MTDAQADDVIPRDKRTDREILEHVDRIVNSLALNGAKTIEELEASLRLLNEPIDSLHLTQRSHEALADAGLNSVRDIVRLRASELVALPKIGRLSRNEIVHVLAQHGLRLRHDVYYDLTRGVN